MAPGLYLPNEFFIGEGSTDVDEVSTGLELSHSAMAFYPYTYLPTLDNNSTSSCFLSSSDSPKKTCKRLKRMPSSDESIGSNNSLCSNSTVNSNGMNRTESYTSLTSLPRLQFRDHVWTLNQRFLAAEAMEEAAAAMMRRDDEDRDEEVNEDGIKLVHILFSCAEAVACRDRSHASTLLSELRTNAKIFGTSFQRVSSCFVQGLADRLQLVQPLGAVGIVAAAEYSMTYTEKKEEALSLVYEICPHIQFGHFVANASILEAFEGESFVHVVDLGMTLGLRHGHQWRTLIDSLANRAGELPRRLRITGVGHSVVRLRTIGDELEDYARSLGINFEFSVVESNLENLKKEDFKLYEGEVLVVNSILQLHCVVKESRGALNSVLQIIHELSPKVLVLVEQDSSHNGPFFLGRFMEALHYYSAIFDSLDAMLPKYDTKRAKIEQFYFAEEIKNIVSCEGPARIERHEKVDQWRRRMSRAGFQPVPIKMISQAKQWLEKIKVCEGYTIVEEKGCLVLGWTSKPIVAASCWKC
ncbi:Transcription factor GRAS [Macleaya cordata]|uniref:Transcription factor GRAS n=1 Tax=Macleaya cordata TaxID=56857 RepID=A0A200R4D0_MACCD|nr:Transcription factor GRAS [Macleaya cordata]